MASVRLKPLKRIKYLKGMRSKLPDIQKVYADYLDRKVPGVKAFLDLDDTEVEDTWRIMGKKPEDYETAKRVVALRRSFGVNGKTSIGTLPELIAYDWLQQNGHQFLFQASTFGGRTKRGGITVDLMVARYGVWYAWPVNGNYWHSYSINQGNDAVENVRLLGQYVGSMKIGKVVTLWESSIYRKRPHVFEMALAGIEIGP